MRLLPEKSWPQSETNLLRVACWYLPPICTTHFIGLGRQSARRRRCKGKFVTVSYLEVFVTWFWFLKAQKDLRGHMTYQIGNDVIIWILNHGLQSDLCGHFSAFLAVHELWDNFTWWWKEKPKVQVALLWRRLADEVWSIRVLNLALWNLSFTCNCSQLWGLSCSFQKKPACLGHKRAFKTQNEVVIFWFHDPDSVKGQQLIFFVSLTAKRLFRPFLFALISPKWTEILGVSWLAYML